MSDGAYSADELAGVADLFGGLTREELLDALDELAYRHGRDVSDSAREAAVDDALTRYALVEYEPDSGADTLLVPGPAAFPTLPPDAEDLPHILDASRSEVDRKSLARDVEERLRGDTARAVAAGDDERMTHLLDVTYDVESWGDVDVADIRDRLDDALE